MTEDGGLETEEPLEVYPVKGASVTHASFLLYILKFISQQPQIPTLKPITNDLLPALDPFTTHDKPKLPPPPDGGSSQ